MIEITDTLALEDSEIMESFITAGGPGGQNVNKTASAAQIRFDVAGSPSLDEGTRARVMHLAGSRLTADGTIVITARRFRSQIRNREDAVDRLVALLREAATPPRQRRTTPVPKRARRARSDEKRRTSQVKKLRRAPPPGSEH